MTAYCSNEYCSFEIINMSLVNAPLLKDYYWKSMNINGFNKILLHLTKNMNESIVMRIPSMPINGSPMRIILHILNQQKTTVEWSLKRVQICDCPIVQQPVGINIFRNVYACPHRGLLTALPKSGEIPSRGIGEIVLHISYMWLGENYVVYDLTIEDNYKIQLKFHFDVYEFSPSKCIVTNSLFPCKVSCKSQPIQPIWILNPHNHDLKFTITTKDKNMRIMDKEVFIRSGTVAPLLVQFSPNRMGDYQIEFEMDFMDIKTTFSINASTTNNYIPVPGQIAPKTDLHCNHTPFTIYRNFLPIILATRETISKMLVLHNQSDLCIAYTWKKHCLKKYFSIEFQPDTGTCKPGHSVICIVKITAGSYESIFPLIPIECHIQKFTGQILMNADELDEYDPSLDGDRQFMYLARLTVNVCLRVNCTESVDIPERPRSDKIFSCDDDVESMNSSLRKCLSRKRFDRDIFDKLWWNFIYNKNFINDILWKKCEKTYRDSIKQSEEGEAPSASYTNKRIFVEVVQAMTTQAIEHLSKNWRFIPEELAKISE